MAGIILTTVFLALLVGIGVWVAINVIHDRRTQNRKRRVGDIQFAHAQRIEKVKNDYWRRYLQDSP